MFEFEANGQKVTAEVSFYTAQLYESEFMSDVIQDLFGSVSEDDTEFVYKDGALVGIDFTKVKWLSVAKALWAAVKTADPTAPGYTAWMREMGGVNMWEIRDTLLGEFGNCFFRPEAPEQDDEGE